MKQNLILNEYNFFKIKFSEVVEMINIMSKSIINCFRYSTNVQLRRQKELDIAKKLKTALSPTFLSVNDTTLSLVSCGEMYKIVIESPIFKQKSRVEQHQLVVNALEEELKTIHGFNLKTRIPGGKKKKKVEQKEDKDESEKEDE